MTNYLAHHGVKGQKWGVRRYQNKDGSLTKAGREKYSKYYNYETKTLTKKGKQILSFSSYGRIVSKQGTISERQFTKALNKAHGEMAYSGIMASLIVAKLGITIGQYASTKNAQASEKRKYDAAHVVDEFMNNHKDVDWNDPSLKNIAEKQASNFMNKKKWSSKDVKNLDSVLDNIYSEYMGSGSYKEMDNNFEPYGYLEKK